MRTGCGGLELATEKERAGNNNETEVGHISHPSGNGIIRLWLPRPAINTDRAINPLYWLFQIFTILVLA